MVIFLQSVRTAPPSAANVSLRSRLLRQLGSTDVSEPTAGKQQLANDTLQPATSGFTLLELLIVMMIIAILAAMAVPAFTRNVQAAKEAVLREDLQVMRTAIGSYTVDKQKAPQSLDDLVTAGYLKVVPKDPITNQLDWSTSQSDTLGSIDQTDSGGIDDVHSGAQQTATDGTSYSSW